MQKKKEEEVYYEFKKVSIAEFFERNRHLLGFDSLRKAIFITVKELVDNSLDACEAARILPDITVKITEKNKDENIYEVYVEDNGPGIPYEHVPDIYGSFLFGGKFHKYTSTRGKQGIGAAAITLYSQLTLGKPIEVISKVKNEKYGKRFLIKINIKSNTPEIIKEEDIYIKKESGVIVKVDILGQYFRGRQSVDEYIKLTSLANPHANITYYTPDGEKIFYKRISDDIPELKEAKPHPHGIELGVLERMARSSIYHNMIDFLSKEFSSIGKDKALEILEKAKIDKDKDPKNLSFEEIVNLHKIMQKMKFRAISSKYITIIGKDLLIKSLNNLFNPDFVYAISRKPRVYRGIPFIVEVGIAYGGEIEKFEVFRFANRVPLIYRAGECAITHGIKEINWKRYGLEVEGDIPKEPLAIMVHVASVWLPFTSESKEAIAPYEEIVKEVELAVKDGLRELSTYLNKMRSLKSIGDKYKTIYGYGLEVASALSKILDLNEEEFKSFLIDKIKEELNSDVVELLRSLRELRFLIKEEKYDLARRSVISLIKPIIESKILSEEEVNRIIDDILNRIKEKKIKIDIE